MQEERGEQDVSIVIIECCQSCESHQWISRHSQWKYFEQFNELKRKIQRFIQNVVVIKNPVPDELIKQNDKKSEQNVYISKNTNQKVTFPRVGAFEIYIYNILLSSKLISTCWPNHYKTIQLLTKIIQDKKKGLDISHYSVYNQEPKLIKDIPQTKDSITFPKKKKNVVRIYKSKDKEKSITKNQEKDITSQLKEKKVQELKSLKIGKLDEVSRQKKPTKIANESYQRKLQSKGETRQKLPPLNTISFSKDDRQEHLKKIFNSIEQIQHEETSFFSNKLQNDKNALILQNKSSRGNKNNSISIIDQVNQDIVFVQNKSVQYSLDEEDQNKYCDFGSQIDDQLRLRGKVHQFVQTIIPSMLDEGVQVKIEKKKNEKVEETQAPKLEETKAPKVEETQEAKVVVKKTKKAKIPNTADPQ